MSAFVLFWKELRFTEDMPISKLVVADVLWKRGWLGRDSASEWREPDMERIWLPEPELDRFIAEGGCGIPELMLRLPRV